MNSTAASVPTTTPTGLPSISFRAVRCDYKCFHNRCAGVIWQDVKPRLGIPLSRNGNRSAASPEDVVPEALRTRNAAIGEVRFMTAREFAQATPAETEWLLDPWVAVGGTTKIDGAPKKAGKTTSSYTWSRRSSTGSDFLGKPTRKGPVVVLTEQGSTSFRESLEGAGLLERDDLYLAVYRDFASLNWDEVVRQAFAQVQAVGAVLLVVDTVPACSGLRGDDENSAGHALAVMQPILVGADTHRVGVVGSFHDRKDGGEVGDSGRGSSAYAGAVDIVLRVTRLGGNFAPTMRKIEALSRFSATPPETYIDLTEEGYVWLGAKSDVVSSALSRKLAELLPGSEDTSMPIETKTNGDGEAAERGIHQYLDEAGVKAGRSTINKELERWREAGYVGRTGEGKKGNPTATG